MKTTMIAPMTDTTMVSTLIPVGSSRFRKAPGKEAADDGPDDAQDDGHQDALSVAHDERGDEAGDGADHDPGDDPHGCAPFSCAWPVRPTPMAPGPIFRDRDAVKVSSLRPGGHQTQETGGTRWT